MACSLRLRTGCSASILGKSLPETSSHPETPHLPWRMLAGASTTHGLGPLASDSRSSLQPKPHLCPGCVAVHKPRLQGLRLPLTQYSHTGPQTGCTLCPAPLASPPTPSELSGLRETSRLQLLHFLLIGLMDPLRSLHVSLTLPAACPPDL